MSDPTISIDDWGDGFTIIIALDDEEKVYHFDQEDTREELRNVFNDLGFYDVTYERQT